jgi:very-short-patch-repair endonuclease
MFIRYNRKLREVSRQLRDNPTKAEKLMWDFLRKYFSEHDFSRQVPMDNFIVDFFCKKQKLIIEIDGSVHDAQKERDIERDNILSVKYQLNILRFTNDEVFKNRLKIKKELENYFTKQYEDLECPL